jgi:hypothetical protein
VRAGLYEMAKRGIPWSQFGSQSGGDWGEYSYHLQRLLALLGKVPELAEAVREVLQGRPCPTAESFLRLRSAGIVSGESAREARPRCRLYADFLRTHLL